jgi:putative ABC transport system permease protein
MARTQRKQLHISRIPGTKLVPDIPFEYEFLDEHFEEMYRADNQVSKIVAVLAGLAIIIACLVYLDSRLIQQKEGQKK